MMIYYGVTFKWSDSIYCANIARATSEDAVAEYYTNKYGWCAVHEATPSEIETARMKGMPFVTIKEEK